MANIKVFVYGTLKRGHRISLDRISGAHFVREAVTADAEYSLYDLGSFPAVAREGHNRILGEVWEVDDHTMQQLDAIEGYPDFYNRSQILTSEGTAWLYHIDDVARTTLCTKIKGCPEQTLAWKHDVVDQ